MSFDNDYDKKYQTNNPYLYKKNQMKNSWCELLSIFILKPNFVETKKANTISTFNFSLKLQMWLYSNAHPFLP